MATYNYATIEKIRALVKTYLDTAKIADPDFTPTKDNMLGMLDKIGLQLTIDGIFRDPLDFMNGVRLEYGKTIEEYFNDLIAPVDFNREGNGNFTYYPITHRPPTYSYTLPQKTFKYSMPYNDFEKAMLGGTQFAGAVQNLEKKFEDSYQLWKYSAKKELLGKYAKRALDIRDTAVALAVSHTYTDTDVEKAVVVYADVDSVRRYAVIQHAFTTDATAVATQFVSALDNGYISEIDLVTELAEPSDTATGEAWIKSAQLYAGIQAEPNSQSLHGSPTLPTPDGERILILNKRLLPSLKVDTLAGAFHKEDLSIDVDVRSVDSFGKDGDDAGIYAILFDKRGVKFHNSYLATRAVQDGDGDKMNFFRHVQDTPFYSPNTFIHVWKKPN